jgi:hypothetical protein
VGSATNPPQSLQNDPQESLNVGNLSVDLSLSLWKTNNLIIHNSAIWVHNIMQLEQNYEGLQRQMA